MNDISSYHAHVYFDAGTVDQARGICESASRRFDIRMGRVHEKAVGPHPMWSCQLEFGPEKAGDVIGWLATNRNGLTVFTHPNTGDSFRDHAEHAIWMGEMLQLNLSAFE